MIENSWLTKKSLKTASQILRSYHNTFNQALIPFAQNYQTEIKLAIILFNLQAPVIAHDNSTEPHIIYANKSALLLWGRCWDEMIDLPSKMTAPEEVRLERKAMLNAITKNNAIKNYEGIRINKKGEQFRISNACIWMLENEQGGEIGQAATFNSWCKIQ